VNNNLTAYVYYCIGLNENRERCYRLKPIHHQSKQDGFLSERINGKLHENDIRYCMHRYILYFTMFFTVNRQRNEYVCMNLRDMRNMDLEKKIFCSYE